MSVCVVDVETTGVAAWSRVVEIGAALVDSDAVFATLCCPDVFDERAERALAYNGIAYADVLAAPPVSNIREVWRDWLRVNGVTEMWAYSRGFDRTMLERDAFAAPWHVDGGSVLALAREHMPWRPKDPSLGDAAEFFLGVRPARAHRALDDARTAAQVLAVLRRL